MNPRPARRWLRPWLLVVAVAIGGAIACAALVPRPAVAPPVTMGPEPREASSEEVHRLCGVCHAYPPPDTFPRFAWRHEVKQGYDFFHADPGYRFDYPPLEAVVRYYENRAPDELAALPRAASAPPPAAQFDRHGYHPPEMAGPPGVDNVNLVQ